MTSDPWNKALKIPHDHICSGRFQAPPERCLRWFQSLKLLEGHICKAQPAQTPLKFPVRFPKEETNVENCSVERSLKMRLTENLQRKSGKAERFRQNLSRTRLYEGGAGRRSDSFVDHSSTSPLPAAQLECRRLLRTPRQNIDST